MRVGIGMTRLMTAMVAAATIAACSGGDEGGTGPTPTIDIALSNAALSVAQGANGKVTVNLTRGGGFTGPVEIALTGQPAGVTATMTTPIASGATSTEITIAAGATAAPGTTNLTVRATGAGVTEKTQTLALTVTAAPSYTIDVTPATRSIAAGTSGTVDIALTRTGGFAGAVGLTVEGLPNGVTGTFNPQSVPGTANSSVLTLNVGAAAATGTSTVTVKGTATGQVDKTKTFQLTVTAASAGSYTLAVTPTTVSVQQGATGTANVALTRTGGFTGAVALTAEGLPNGVTASFNPASVTTTDASVLTLTVGAGAAAGTATITVKGTATDQLDKTATFPLTITAAGGYTLAVTPTAVTVQQGGSGTATVNLTRTGGFAGAVTLAATGLPNGVTAAFNPTAPTGNTSALTLTASGTATLGQATVTITGTAAGIANQTTTLALTVTAVTGGTGNTTWEFCAGTGIPVWVAVQDGNGAWTRVAPTGSKYVFNIASGRGGVAYVTSATGSSVSGTRVLARRASALLETALLMRNKAIEARASSRYAARASAMVDGFDLSVYYGTQTELNAQGTSQCPAGTTGKTVNGSVANVSAQQTADITLGVAPASANAATPTFQLTNVPDGSLDLIASRSTFDLTTFATVVDKIIIRRGLNQPNNSTLPVLDFNAAEAFAPAEANITVGNLGGDQAILGTTFFTSGASGAGLFSGSGVGTGPFKYFGVPTARQVAGDLHFAFAAGFPANGTGDDFRLAGLFFKNPTDRTVTLGAALPAQTVSVAGTAPYVRLRAQGSVTAAYNKFVTVTFKQATAARDVTLEATAAYLANATTYDLTIPDFSGVAGWDNNWGLKQGAATNWLVLGAGFTGIGVDTPDPVEGATIQSASTSGTITP